MTRKSRAKRRRERPVADKGGTERGEGEGSARSYRGWDWANGRWYYGERWIKGKFDVWNWCARRLELTT